MFCLQGHYIRVCVQVDDYLLLYITVDTSSVTYVTTNRCAGGLKVWRRSSNRRYTVWLPHHKHLVVFFYFPGEADMGPPLFTILPRSITLSCSKLKRTFGRSLDCKPRQRTTVKWLFEISPSHFGHLASFIGPNNEMYCDVLSGRTIFYRKIR